MITEVGAEVDLFEEENDDDGALIGEEVTDATIKGGSLKSNLLRVCVLNVWAKKLDIEGAPFSTDKLLGEWLKDGITFFNSCVPTWSVSTGDTMGPLPPDLFQNVRKLATGWLRNMNGKFRNKLQDTTCESMPVGDFLEDVIISSKRSDWENYFNCVILNAKVSLCGVKRSRVAGTSDSAEKRRAVEAGITSTANSSVFLKGRQRENPSVSSPAVNVPLQQQQSGTASTREMIGSFGNLIQETMKIAKIAKD